MSCRVECKDPFVISSEVPQRAPFYSGCRLRYAICLMRNQVTCQLGPTGRALARCGIAKNLVAAFGFERLDLAGEVLLQRADTGVTDAALLGATFDAHL